MKKSEVKGQIYPEVVGELVRDRPAPPPRFPSKCPCCGAPKVDHAGYRQNVSVLYACGGAYGPKPQIQTHTHYWWGACPKGGAK